MQKALSTNEIFQLLTVVCNVPGDRNRRGIPTLFEGLPSTAKTAFVEQYARMAKFGFNKFLLSQSDASELIGVPVKSTNPVAVGDLSDPLNSYQGYVLDYVPQKWAVNAFKHTHSILFFDEFNLGDKSTLDAAQTALTHGTLGDLQLPQHMVILGAQNKAAMVSGTPFNPAMASRWLHIASQSVPVSEFVEYLQHLPLWYDVAHVQEQNVKVLSAKECDDLLREKWPKVFIAATKLVGEFILNNPDSRYVLPPVGDNTREYGWACDRQWVTACRIIAGCQVFETSQEVRYALLVGCIGSVTARPLLDWINKRAEVPLLTDVLSGKWLPNRKRVDQAHAVQAALLSWADKATPEERAQNITNIWLLVKRLYEASLPDVGSVYQKALMDRKWFLKDKALFTEILSIAATKSREAGIGQIGRKHGT